MKPRRPLTPHQNARLIGWARLWLTWLSSVLMFLIEHFPQRANRLTYVGARAVAHLVFAAAGPPKRAKCVRVYGRIRRRSSLRALLGSRLRRAYSLRDPLQRFIATLEMLRDFDAEVARFRVHSATGLMRRLSRAYAWVNETPRSAPFAPVACADSS